MKNALKKRLPAVFVGMLLAVLAAGCGNGEGEIYPLTVDGTAITLDVTTMQTIYDAGFEVTVLDTSTMDRYEIAGCGQRIYGSEYRERRRCVCNPRCSNRRCVRHE